MKIFTTIASALLLALAGCTSNTKSYDVCSFGATGDGTTDDAAAIQKAIDKCSDNGGGTVVFPSAKTFMAGPIHLRSNVNQTPDCWPTPTRPSTPKAPSAKTEAKG